MERITIAAVDAELARVLESPMSVRAMEYFNLLCRTRKYLASMDCDFGEEQAREWVARMSPAAKWTMEQTTELMHKRGYDHNPCEFWAVMCMLYSDYGKTLIKYNADKPEVWADMADAWITDPDVRPHKTGIYYRDVVGH